MNRISVRLAIAMFAVSMIALFTIPLATTLAERQAVNRLPGTLRDQVDDFSRPALPLMPRPDQRDRRMAQMDAPAESVALLTLVRDLRQFRQTSVVLTVAVALLASVFLAWRLSSRLARPIEAVSGAAARMASGDLAARAKLDHPEQHPLEVRLLAENFNSMASSLESLEAERKAMIADLAHELRNPLATLTLRLDAAAQGLVTLDRAEVSTLQSQANLLTRLVEDLQTLSLVDGGRVTLSKETIAVQELLRSAAEAYGPIASQSRIGLHLEMPDEFILVNVDRDRIQQVLHNLLENALRAASDGSDVRVVLHVEGNEATISVEDQGEGISVSPPERIFERFVHGDRRDGRRSGRGLGLAIVKTLVEMHGGTVFATRHDSVTSIGFTLPLSRT